MDNKSLENALNQFGYDLVQELAAELQRLGKNASGDLIRSLTYNLVPSTGDNIELDIIAEDYLEVVDKGRRPGKQPPIASIQKWAQIKGIDPKYVYPIARKIGRDGIPATNFVSKVLEANKQKYLNIIAKSAAKQIEVDAVKEIKKGLTN